MLGGGVLLGIITVLVTSLKSYTVTPADVLPADATLLLFSTADDALLRRYEPWMPVLHQLPEAQVPRTVAVVEDNRGEKVLVVFARRPVAPDALPSGSGWTRKEVGPLFVSASSETIFPSFTAPERPLRSSPAFIALSVSDSESTSWIYLNRSLLPAPVSLTDAVVTALLLPSTTHLAIVPRADGGAAVRSFPAGPEGRAALLPAPAAIPPLFSVALAQPSAFLQSLTTALPQDQRLVLTSRILTFVSAAFGDSVSFTYDLAPLLERPASLSLHRTASGSVALLLSGSAPQADGRMAKLHEAFRGSRTTAQIVTRTFDGRYTYRNVRDSAAMLTDDWVTVGSTRMHRTMHAVEGQFCSAVDGDQFFLSTDCALLQRMLAERMTGPGAPALAAGSFSRTNLSTLLKGTLPALLSSSSPLLPSQIDALQWSVSRQGNARTLTILPLP